MNKNNPLATLKLWPETKQLIDIAASLHGVSLVELVHSLIVDQLKRENRFAEVEKLINQRKTE